MERTTRWACERSSGQFPAPDYYTAGRPGGRRSHTLKLTLGADLTRAWNSPGVSVETRKKIIRLLICEIIVDAVGEKLDPRISTGKAAIIHGLR